MEWKRDFGGILASEIIENPKETEHKHGVNIRERKMWPTHLQDIKSIKICFTIETAHHSESVDKKFLSKFAIQDFSFQDIEVIGIPLSHFSVSRLLDDTNHDNVFHSQHTLHAVFLFPLKLDMVESFIKNLEIALTAFLVESKDICLSNGAPYVSMDNNSLYFEILNSDQHYNEYAFAQKMEYIIIPSIEDLMKIKAGPIEMEIANSIRSRNAEYRVLSCSLIIENFAKKLDSIKKNTQSSENTARARLKALNSVGIKSFFLQGAETILSQSHIETQINERHKLSHEIIDRNIDKNFLYNILYPLVIEIMKKNRDRGVI